MLEESRQRAQRERDRQARLLLNRLRQTQSVINLTYASGKYSEQTCGG